MVGARSTVQTQNFKNDGFGPLLQVKMSKNCTPLGREAQFKHVQTQNVKNDGLGPLLEVKMSKNCTPLWPEAH